MQLVLEKLEVKQPKNQMSRGSMRDASERGMEPPGSEYWRHSHRIQGICEVSVGRKPDFEVSHAKGPAPEVVLSREPPVTQH